jgi:hypothetical protein
MLAKGEGMFEYVSGEDYAPLLFDDDDDTRRNFSFSSSP